ncbi:MAG: DUF4153 domain-containing protein [Paludibacter sp.]|nr:DUF4153 domain-containing protein [Paludibacter sp.]
MRKLSIQELTTKLLLVLQRFYLVLIFLMGTALFFLVRINYPEHKLEDSTLTFFILTSLFYIPVSFLLENNTNKIQGLLLMVIPVLLMGYYCFSLLNLDLPIDQYQVFILGLVFVLFSFVVSFLRKETDIPFWSFTKIVVTQIIITVLFASVLFAGLSLAIYSLEVLFKIDISNKVYQNLSVLCYVLFAPVYFLSNVPEKAEMCKQDNTFDKFFKILGLYIFLPILALYTLILYVYLVQIIIKWELPNGWVSTLVSILGLGGFLCMFILYPLRLQNDNKFVNILSKYFPVVLMPLLVLMSIGIFRRLGDYGLTVNRCLVLILNLWFYGISIYLFVTKSKHLKWIVISFATVALIVSVGPWSVFSITKNSMEKEIGQLLNDAKLLKDGKIVDNSNFRIVVDTVTSKRLSEDIKYTFRNYGYSCFEPYFKQSIQKWDAFDVIDKLGLKDEEQEHTYFNAYTNRKDLIISIESYKKFIELNGYAKGKDTLCSTADLKVVLKNKILFVYQNGAKNPTITISLATKFNMFHQGNDERTLDTKDMTIEGVNYKLVILSMNGNFIRQDSVSLNNIEAYLFLK